MYYIASLICQASLLLLVLLLALLNNSQFMLLDCTFGSCHHCCTGQGLQVCPSKALCSRCHSAYEVRWRRMGLPVTGETSQDVTPCSWTYTHMDSRWVSNSLRSERMPQRCE
jgi:hypothetical protein